jgi:hypothetical protein
VFCSFVYTTGKQNHRLVIDRKLSRALVCRAIFFKPLQVSQALVLAFLSTTY